MRPKIGMMTMVRDKMSTITRRVVVVGLFPSSYAKVASKASDSTKLGIDNITLNIAVTTTSYLPRKYAAATPMKVPIEPPRKTEKNETRIEIRVPLMMPGRRSIPSREVPKMKPLRKGAVPE